MPDPVLELEGLEVALRHRGRRCRDVCAQVGPGEIVGLIGPERRRQVDHAPRDHGRRHGPRRRRSGCAGAPCADAPGVDRTARCRARAEAAASSATSPSRRTCDWGSRPTATTGAAIPLARAYDLFPMLKEFRRRSAGVLSGGQQRQLAIGRALVAKPDVLLLDEPSLGLAPRAGRRGLPRTAKDPRAGRDHPCSSSSAPAHRRPRRPDARARRRRAAV